MEIMEREGMRSSSRSIRICCAAVFLSVSFCRPASPASDSVDLYHWSVLFQARVETLHDSLATIGVRPDASQRFDSLYDKPCPPSPPGDWLQVYFPHVGDNWPNLLGTRFAVDVTQPELPSWLMNIETTLDTGTITVSWDTSALHGLPREYAIYMRDSSAHVTINLRNQNSYVFFYTAARIFSLWTKFNRIGVSVSSGWNMLSLPLVVSDSSARTLFPAAISNAFEYDVSYIIRSALQRGRGYWLKFKSNQNLAIAGYQGDQNQVSAVAGWNLIGPFDRTVTAPSGGLISSRFFGYDGGYKQVDTLKPGRGYWIKMKSAGVITLGGTVAAQKPADESGEGTISLNVRDNGQGCQKLLIRDGAQHHFCPSMCEMPPKPPDGIFDARFCSQMFMETYEPSLDGSMFTIEIQSANYPIVITDEVCDAAVNQPEATVDGKTWSVLPYTVKDPSVHTVVIRLRSGHNRIQEFRLDHNYPNPFNPTTFVHFAVPELSAVRVVLFDPLGREISLLSQSDRLAGEYTLEVNVAGLGLSSGTYFCRLEATGMKSGYHFQQTNRILYLK